jgi:hypothetical protein
MAILLITAINLDAPSRVGEAGSGKSRFVIQHGDPGLRSDYFHCEVKIAPEAIFTVYATMVPKGYSEHKMGMASERRHFNENIRLFMKLSNSKSEEL